MPTAPNLLEIARLAQLAQTPEGRRLIAERVVAKGVDLGQVRQSTAQTAPLPVAPRQAAPSQEGNLLERIGQAAQAVQAVQPPATPVLSPVAPQGARSFIDPNILAQLVQLGIFQPQATPNLGSLIGG